MEVKRVFKNFLKDTSGGVGTIIAMVVSIILVLGLISYTILGQVAGARDTGDRALIEQDKVNQMLKDPNVVTGNVVKYYYYYYEQDGGGQGSQGEGRVDVDIKDKTGGDLGIEKVVDGALFRQEKEYDANGELEKITFRQIDLSRKPSGGTQ